MIPNIEIIIDAANQATSTTQFGLMPYKNALRKSVISIATGLNLKRIVEYGFGMLTSILKKIPVR